MNALLFGTSVALFCGLGRSEPVPEVKKEAVIVKSEVEEELDDELSADCANCPNGMEGSVKPYDRHIIVCDTRHDWPKSIDKNTFFPYNIITKLDANKKNDLKITVTGCRHITSIEDDQVEVIVYPDRLSFTLREQDFDAFSELVYSKQRLQLDQLKSFPFRVSEPFTEKLILVCTHKRDVRCQTLGPQVIVEMRRLLKEQSIDEASIAVRQTSHIGGHAFAGTLIVYPDGVWYGQVSVKAVKSLLKAIQEGRQHAKCFRGKAGGRSIEW